MTSGRPEPATPLQVAMYGHIAAALRGYCQAASLSTAQLGAQLGLKHTHISMVYKWLSGKGAPSPPFRAKLAKITGIPARDLERRDPPSTLTVTDAPLLLLPGTVGRPPGRPPAPAEVLSIGMAADGETRIRLDVRLPMAKAMLVIRLLFDAGLVVSDPERGEEG